jgi:hypothetical protein
MFRIAISIVVLSASTLACSFLPPVRKVSRSFSVHVKNDVGPVAGLKLKVSRFKMDDFEKLTDEQQRSADPSNFVEVIARSITDATGTAPFNLDRTGAFTLSPDSPASHLDGVGLDVSDQTRSAVVELQWPTMAILRTVHLRGKLSKGLFSSRSTPLKNNGLTLHTLVDYREVSATTTGDDGAFDFRGVAPGLYFLQILATPGRTSDFYKPEGNIAIYVAPDNSHDTLMISTVNTSCGLSYDLEENKARYKPEACFKGGKPVQCDY